MLRTSASGRCSWTWSESSCWATASDDQRDGPAPESSESTQLGDREDVE
jgi:hypothetical protein